MSAKVVNSDLWELFHYSIKSRHLAVWFVSCSLDTGQREFKLKTTSRGLRDKAVFAKLVVRRRGNQLARSSARSELSSYLPSQILTNCRERESAMDFLLSNSYACRHENLPSLVKLSVAVEINSIV